jgi:hypothetical protein
VTHKISKWTVAVFGLLLFALPALAHHSFVAEFDGDKKFAVTGVLTKVMWTNPHIALFLDAKDDAGKTVTYMFASGPPSTLHRAGVRQDDFKVGETVTITAAPAKDGTKRLGWLQMIKYPDGHVFVYRNGSE